MGRGWVGARERERRVRNGEEWGGGERERRVRNGEKT